MNTCCAKVKVIYMMSDRYFDESKEKERKEESIEVEIV